MLGGVLLMGGLGMAVGIGLALASKIFYVWVDPKIEAIEEALPGANCGGCGLPGCSANAVAIAAGRASASSCVAGGPEVAAEIAEIMGVKLEAREPDFARPGCTYGFQDADVKYIYSGITDCRAAVLLNGGSKICPIGCIGLGTCVDACPFNALSMGEDNLPVVNLDRCTGCGTCERVCPKHIITLSSYSRRIQHEYTIDECSAPCQRECPAGIDIPAYIRQITMGDYSKAVRIIKETNPFPLVCGRICVHPCEYACRRNLVDEPVAINHLKRFVADYEMNSGKRIHNPRAPETGKKVAVVGGGAEGLTAAYLLNRLGHDSVVYESTNMLGGLLRYGLPQNRLPKKVLDWEIEGILDAGVKVFINKSLGREFTIESLLNEGYSAVFVATGGWDTHLSLKNANNGGFIEMLPGVMLLIDFLMEQRAGNKISTGKKLVILGGGKAGLEAASNCMKDGADSVTVVLRSARNRAPFSDEEIAAAEEQGVRFFFESALTKLMGEGNSLTSLEVTHLNASGTEDGEREIIPVNTLLTGAGRFPELIYVPLKGEDEENSSAKWETIVPYPGPFAEQDIGIFRPGEEGGDYKAVVEAIGSGRRACSSIQRFFSGEALEAPENMIRKYTEVLSLDKLEPVPEMPRVKMPEVSPEECLNNPSLEIAKGFTEDQARQEAGRCLQCGLICYRRVEGNLH
ncbi:MAG: FAD-dependent oxidoreductase [Deltaproteobacteria bacterium]|nr:FAD-dependent oxidoreductase [Deltaproteobacteria bacterium]